MLTMQSGHDQAKPSPPVRKRRLRARKACEPCRARKRKCDGKNPCECCVKGEYECHYVSVRAKRTSVVSEYSITPESHSAPQAANEDSEGSSTAENHQFHSPEANSGAAFVRKLAMSLDPANAPRSRLFAWNLFLGTRTLDYSSRAQPVVQIISRPLMESLAAVYLEKVDPCYGFIDQDVLRQRIQSRWEPNALGDSYDAVLCGVAALGYLFSHINVVVAELDLVETAKSMLEQCADAQPGIDIVTGWVLRVAYLRMTALPHKAWMASCTMMHTIEASGIRGVRSSHERTNVSPDLWRRVYGIARHLNVWSSFDLGRSRVVLPHPPPPMPAPRQGDYSVELLNLLSWSESLDSDKDIDPVRLQNGLRDVLKQEHTEPPSVLAQTNLALLLVRRLRGLNFNLSGSLLDEVLVMTKRALHSAQAMLNAGNPWHHVANIPFQIVYILLAIDTTSAITQLGDAVRTLSNVTQVYNTDAAREALNTACLLISLYQKRKDADAKSLAHILHTYSTSSLIETQNASSRSYDVAAEILSLNNPSWLEDLITDIPDIQAYDFGLPTYYY